MDCGWLDVEGEGGENKRHKNYSLPLNKAKVKGI